MALFLTDGNAIGAGGPAVPNCMVDPVQRPGSTQNTPRSMGSLSAGMMRSAPMTRSCLPPVTISPASKTSGRLELFTSTSWLTWAPVSGAGVGLPRTRPRTLPDSVTTTSPDFNPSSSVRNSRVSCEVAATTGNTVRLPCRIAGNTL